MQTDNGRAVSTPPSSKPTYKRSVFPVALLGALMDSYVAISLVAIMGAGGDPLPGAHADVGRSLLGVGAQAFLIALPPAWGITVLCVRMHMHRFRALLIAMLTGLFANLFVWTALMYLSRIF